MEGGEMGGEDGEGRREDRCGWLGLGFANLLLGG